jgi:Rieske Fe-S protein
MTSHERATSPERLPEISRRPVLGVGVAAAATVFVAACGSSNVTSSGGSAPSASQGGVLAKLADVPVGGAVSARAPDGAPILITQPAAGTVVGLSAKCTHMGCTVAPAGKELDCPCHHSSYDLNGKNLGGPAPRPLPPFPVKVVGGDVVPA